MSNFWRNIRAPYCCHRVLWYFPTASWCKNVSCSEFILCQRLRHCAVFGESDVLTLSFTPLTASPHFSAVLSPLFNRVLASRYRRSPLCPRPTLLSIKTPIGPLHAPSGSLEFLADSAVPRAIDHLPFVAASSPGRRFSTPNERLVITLGSVRVWSLFRGGRERGGPV